MKIKMLKDQSWSIKGRISPFKKDGEYEISDDKVASEMIKFGYGIEVKKEVKAEEEKAITSEFYENKAMQSEERKVHKKRGRKSK